MNTIRSVSYGWLTLIVAGGGAYYFAKKSINAERAEKAEADRLRREAHARLQAAEFGSHSSTNYNTRQGAPAGGGSVMDAGDPSQEASQDPAPTRHAPSTEGQRVVEKSKYEASEPFRSRKGDRFS